MNKQRWIALGVAAALLAFSLIFRFTSTLFSSDVETLLDGPEDQFQQEVIDKGSGHKIAVLELNGTIQDTSQSSLLDEGYNHDRFLKKLEHVGEDRSVDGIILRLNTPGGGVVESDEIHDKMVEIQEDYDKPIYVSMGNTTASGGYYISASADKIVAHPATLTGSIGVIMQSVNVSELADDLGVDVNTIKSGKYKDIMSQTRKMTDDERDILQSMVDDMYDDFVQVIADGRDMSESKVRDLGDGRVYTGEQAADNGLVDDLGDFDDTTAMMEDDYDWSDAQVVKYKSNAGVNRLLGGWAQDLFRGDDTELKAVQELLQQSDGPRAMYLYSK